MWRRLPVPKNKEVSAATTAKDMRLARVYADEDIEDGAVEWLRARGVNMKSARELGHRGKPDSFHAALVFKQRRFLLTKNGKHFLDDQKLPFPS